MTNPQNDPKTALDLTPEEQPETVSAPEEAEEEATAPATEETADKEVSESEDKIKPEDDGESNGESKDGKKKQRKKLRGWRLVRRILLILLIILLSLTLIAGCTVLWMYHQGKSELLQDEIPAITPPDNLADIDDENRVVYNGVTYEYNQNVTAILVVGVDKTDIQEDSVYGQNGQADTLFLAALDTDSGNITIIPLSRETMVDVDQYAVDGSFLGVQKTQLCLAYAYGSNGEEGCQNVVRSVSRLLYGVPINSYLAIDMDGVEAVTDTIGGVPVKALEDVYHPFTKKQITKKGETITLNGKDALTYMRHRDNDADANNRRMKRLRQFFTAFINRSGSKIKQDFGLLTDYYDAAKPYTITNINLSRITYLAGCTLTGNSWQDPTYLSIAGESVKGEKHNEFYADTTSAFEAVLEAFYTPVE